MKMRISVIFLFSVSLSNDDRVERSQVSFKQNCNSAQVMAASNVGVFREARIPPTWIPEADQEYNQLGTKNTGTVHKLSP